MFQSALLLPGRQQNALEVRHIDNILHAITSHLAESKRMNRMIKSWKMKLAEQVARVQNEKLMSFGSEMWPPAAGWTRRSALSRTSYYVTSLVP